VYPHRRRATVVAPQAEAQAPPPRGLQQPRSDSEEQFSELQVNRTLPYLDDVKTAFTNQPHLYREFLDIIKAFSGTEMDTPPPLIARMSYLFPTILVCFCTQNLLEGANDLYSQCEIESSG
jgi:histone deacetylase complex regulatory component SIN3